MSFNIDLSNFTINLRQSDAGLGIQKSTLAFIKKNEFFEN